MVWLVLIKVMVDGQIIKQDKSNQGNKVNGNVLFL